MMKFFSYLKKIESRISKAACVYSENLVIKVPPAVCWCEHSDALVNIYISSSF